MTADYQTIERLAVQLCTARWGADHWDGKGTKRGYWRRKAAREIDRARSIATADAFFGIFGMRRAE